MASSLEEMSDEDESLIVREEITNHLEILSKPFNGYFWVEKLETSEEWILSPYSFKLDYMQDDEKLKDNLIELCTNRFVKMQFESLNIGVAQWTCFQDFVKKHYVCSSHSRRLTCASLDLVLFCQSKQI